MTDTEKRLEGTLTDEPHMGFLREVWSFLSVTKKWWLLPIIVVFGLMGALIMLSGSAAAPFIYTLF